MRRVLFIAAALLMVAVGCKNRDNTIVPTPETNLVVETTELSVSHEAQKVEIEVLCNEEFDVEEQVFWLAVTNVRDGENETKVIVLNVLANESEEARSAEVVIVAGNVKHTVTITQSGMVAISMEVVIVHRNQIFTSPMWGGEAVSGSINWGDDTAEEYAEGAMHEYADSESHAATFTMSGATSFEIEKIGDMESLTIAVD